MGFTSMIPKLSELMYNVDLFVADSPRYCHAGSDRPSQKHQTALNKSDSRRYVPFLVQDL